MARKLAATLLMFSCAFLIQSAASAQDAAKKDDAKKIVFVAGTPSHGYGAHEHFAGCKLLAKTIQDARPDYEVVVWQNGWPRDASAFDNADAIVMYADGGGRHPVLPHLEAVDKLSSEGVGVVCLHYGVEIPAGEPGDHLLKWIGGFFESNWSVNPHWKASFDAFPEHPITSGVQPFAIDDEWYYHMRFREGMKGVTPILTALPPKETLTRPDGPHSGNPHVREAVLDRKEPQYLAWASENESGSRGFGFTGGHYHWNWGDPNFRKLVANAIVWSAKGDVPANGIGAEAVSVAALGENQDYDPPENFNPKQIGKRLSIPVGKFAKGKKKDKAKDKEKDDGGLALQAAAKPKMKKPAKENKPAPAEQKEVNKDNDNSGGDPNAKPIFVSPIVTSATSGKAVEAWVDIAGATDLYLVVSDAGDGNGCEWANWAEPQFFGEGVSEKLTDLKYESATSGHGKVQINKTCNDTDMKVDGKAVEYGIGTHSPSVIHYKLKEGVAYRVFKARCALDDGGSSQGNCGESASLQFLVYTTKPDLDSVRKLANQKQRSPENAVEGLDVADGLQAKLFAAEPQLLSLTNCDVDHLGRVWACEVVNYRRHNGKRPEGDRILVCDDRNGDGVADDITVFYQGPEIDSVHGVCVLPTPNGKGARAILSANDKVWMMTDVDGDLKADEKRVMFTGISGTQHDHGIHAFVFGPDGRLYFNFGNAGKQIKDANGKPIVDKAGNEVNDKRQPYQEGMVFRCNMDGSGFETLGWNFRNNWEISVDSFGSLWQSDNDDDGNKGVRINFVMEFGNYGYKDELTGAGWRDERTGWEDTIPERHWHLNDPGSVPNLLQTGAGSPTGILVYEGDLLPEQFRNQVIHCDAGPNVVRAYPVEPDGAGYSADMVNVLFGARDKWFRPSDVCVAPDGSLIVADWYDPGVGGHAMGDLERGRLFRVAPPNKTYIMPKYDYSTAEGAAEALKNPNLAVRYMAWTALHEMGEKAEGALQDLYFHENPRFRARALWLLAKIDGRARQYTEMALVDGDPNIRIVGLRLARMFDFETLPIVKQMLDEDSAHVRREMAIALRGQTGKPAARVWAELAAKHDGKDRWYLEALGIGATGNWDECVNEFLNTAGIHPERASWRDVVWRSRAAETPNLLVRIFESENAGDNEDRYMRAFDFLSGDKKDTALEKLLEFQLSE